MPDPTPTPEPTAPAPAPESSWRDGLPEDLRAEKSLEQIKAKDAAEALPLLAKGYVSAQKLVGQRPAAEPVPESWEKYEGVDPEGVSFDAEARSGFLKEMHKAGAPPSMIKTAMAWYAAYAKTATAKKEAADAIAFKQAEQASVKKLEESWGPQGSTEYNYRIKLANAAVKVALDAKAIDSDDYAEITEQAVNPKLVRLFSWYGEQIEEAKQYLGDSIGPVDAADLDAAIDRQRETLIKLQSSGGAEYEAALDRYETLLSQRGAIEQRRRQTAAA